MFFMACDSVATVSPMAANRCVCGPLLVELRIVERRPACCPMALSNASCSAVEYCVLAAIELST
jgi:hypothetical protein